MIANTPNPPYYAVIFTSTRTKGDNDYSNTSAKMMTLAAKQKGFLGVETAREKLGITVSYWESLEAIKNWKENTKHSLARRKGRELWYETFKVRICKVEKAYGFEK